MWCCSFLKPAGALLAASLAVSAPFVASAAQPQAGSETLARIARNGTVRVGYIPTPGTFAFQNDKGETVGYSIDICQRVVGGIRQALGRPDLQVSYRPVQPSQRIPLLKSGEIDIECGGNTNTVSRQKDIDFSFTFFNTGVRFLVRKPFDVERPSTLIHKKVAVTKGTTASDIVERLKNEVDVQPVLVASDDEGARMVETGQVDAFAQDDVLLYGLIAGSSMRDRLAVSGKFMTVEPYAFMLPKDDIVFRDLVDKTLSGLMHSGEIFSIYRKWFDTDRLRIPMNVYMKENVRFPNRYGIP